VIPGMWPPFRRQIRTGQNGSNTEIAEHGQHLKAPAVKTRARRHRILREEDDSSRHGDDRRRCSTSGSRPAVYFI